MPVIIGNNAQETMQFVGSVGPLPDAASYEAGVRKVFGAEAAPRILAAYPASAYATPRDAMVQLTTDGLFTCQSRRVARALAQAQSEPVHRYLFAHALENDPEQKALGAVHTVEHMFFFPWQGKYQPDESDLAVQRLMVGHWVALARDGQLPPTWPRAVPGDTYLRIARSTAAPATDDAAHCDVWDTVRLPWPHL
jgi:para-nitrobenzyl esterase